MGSEKKISVEPIVRLNDKDYYYEEDMLKRCSNPESFDPNKRELMAMEIYDIAQHKIRNYWVGYCCNSIPTYARAQESVKGQRSRMSTLNPSSSILQDDNSKKDNNQDDNNQKDKKQEDNSQYNELCPKVSWGLSAYLLCFIEYIGDNKFPFLYKQSGKYLKAIDLIKTYYADRLSIYKTINAKDYTIATDLNDAEKIRKLDASFNADFFRKENELLARTEKNECKFDIKEVKVVCSDAKKALSAFKQELNRPQLEPSDKWMVNGVDIRECQLRKFIPNDKTLREFINECNMRKALSVVKVYKKLMENRQAKEIDFGERKSFFYALIQIGLISQDFKYNTFRDYI